jgi:diguanylate cyclase (GGDEF)-like protein
MNEPEIEPTQSAISPRERRRSDRERARRASDDLVPVADAPSERQRKIVLYLYEASVYLPVLCFIVAALLNAPREFGDWQLLTWIAAIAIVDLLPVPTQVQESFSLGFPLELAVAILYPAPVAAAVALLGSSDPRELHRAVPFTRALFNRAQVAAAVMVESFLFHSAAELSSRWYILGLAVLVAAIGGYAVNMLLVATLVRFKHGQRMVAIIQEMHSGVFGEFVLSYMGLALFSVLVALSFKQLGTWAIFVFIAPLAFARQMFQRTHSLQVATEELAVKQAENEFQALHDSLTGLPNRVLFQQKLAEAIDEAAAVNGSLAVMLMDLDHFKEINDTLGHHFGDMLLTEIGPRLATVLRPGDMMARLGGDEFGVLLPDIPDESVAIRIAERLAEELERPITVEGLALDVSGSIGIAIYPEHSHNGETLLRRADVSMYAAKEAGGGFEVYHRELDRDSPARLALISHVRPALERGEFVLFYQPKVRLSDGKVAGAEALIRWEHPELGLVPPDEFIPLVEKTVLLRPLTAFVLEESMRQWREWADRGVRLQVAVNISVRSLLDNQLPGQVAEILARYEVPPAFLKLELTESFLMADSGRSTGVLDGLSDVGVNLSIDDFGTGYSSLSHLKRLPIQEIKIDRSFVMNMLVDANDSMIVRATVELGKNLGLQVVAEGVEDRETWDLLASFGCDEAQGYFFSRPIPSDEFWRWLSVRDPNAMLQPSPPDSSGRLHAI